MIKRKEYINRINNALVFIDQNLSINLSLAIVAKEAYYSPYHFHRIFTAIIGEPLNTYINRKRIEKAASLLLHKDSFSISEIAMQTGFNSNASFTRSFNKFYNLSPSEFKKSTKTKFSKIRKTKSKNGEKTLLIESYICNINNHLNWITMNANIEVKELPKMRLAYITQVGSLDRIGEAYSKLMKWAAPKGVLAAPDLKAVTIYHDSPKITDENKLRISACFTIGELVETNGEVSKRDFFPKKCIVARMEITIDKFKKAWESMFVWMNENGYEFDNEREPFGIYHNDFNTHPEKKSIVDICIPVK